MQEREIIYKILFSSVAPYLLIIANLIIVVCIIKILWITVKNKNKKSVRKLLLSLAYVNSSIIY